MTPASATGHDPVGMKQRLRRQLRASRDSMTPELRRQKSRDAGTLCLATLREAQTVAIYNPTRSELDPAYLVARLRERGCSVVYPRMVADTSILEFARVDVEHTFTEGSFQIFEPSTSAPLQPLDSIDAFVIPGLAFDSSGNRLGWGKGYYDHTLAQASRALRVGLCFHEQITTSLPCDRTDQRMDWVITDREAFAGPPRHREHGPKETS